MTGLAPNGPSVGNCQVCKPWPSLRLGHSSRIISPELSQHAGGYAGTLPARASASAPSTRSVGIASPSTASLALPVQPVLPLTTASPLNRSCVQPRVSVWPANSETYARARRDTAGCTFAVGEYEYSVRLSERRTLCPLRVSLLSRFLSPCPPLHCCYDSL